MTPASKNRLIAIGALLIAGGALAFIAYGKMGENLVYYWTPGELISQGERAYGPTIRLGGVVAPGSIVWNPEHTALTFLVADGRTPEAKTVKVAATQTPPQMFREGIGVVVEGTYDSAAVFKTNRLMVNHSNEYRAPKDGQGPDWKTSVSETATTTP